MKGDNEKKHVPIQIKTEGPLERVVMDGWKLHDDLAKITGFTIFYLFDTLILINIYNFFIFKNRVL